MADRLVDRFTVAASLVYGILIIPSTYFLCSRFSPLSFYFFHLMQLKIEESETYRTEQSFLLTSQSYS